MANKPVFATIESGITPTKFTGESLTHYTPGSVRHLDTAVTRYPVDIFGDTSEEGASRTIPLNPQPYLQNMLGGYEPAAVTRRLSVVDPSTTELTVSLTDPQKNTSEVTANIVNGGILSVTALFEEGDDPGHCDTIEAVFGVADAVIIDETYDLKTAQEISRQIIQLCSTKIGPGNSYEPSDGWPEVVHNRRDGSESQHSVSQTTIQLNEMQPITYDINPDDQPVLAPSIADVHTIKLDDSLKVIGVTISSGPPPQDERLGTGSADAHREVIFVAPVQFAKRTPGGATIRYAAEGPYDNPAPVYVRENDGTPLPTGPAKSRCIAEYTLGVITPQVEEIYEM